MEYIYQIWFTVQFFIYRAPHPLQYLWSILGRKLAELFLEDERVLGDGKGISSTSRIFLKLLTLSICNGRWSLTVPGLQAGGGWWGPQALQEVERRSGGRVLSLFIWFIFLSCAKPLKLTRKHGPLGPSALGILWRLRFQSIRCTARIARVCSPNPPSVFYGHTSSSSHAWSSGQCWLELRSLAPSLSCEWTRKHSTGRE